MLLRGLRKNAAQTARGTVQARFCFSNAASFAAHPPPSSPITPLPPPPPPHPLPPHLSATPPPPPHPPAVLEINLGNGLILHARFHFASFFHYTTLVIMAGDSVSTASRTVGHGTIPLVRDDDADGEAVVMKRLEEEGHVVVVEGEGCAMPYKAMVCVPPGPKEQQASGGGASGKAFADKVRDVVTSTLHMTEAAFSPFRADSEVAALNGAVARALAEGAGAGRCTPGEELFRGAISDDMLAVLKAARTLQRVTRGSFDPTYNVPRLLNDANAARGAPTRQYPSLLQHFVEVVSDGQSTDLVLRVPHAAATGGGGAPDEAALAALLAELREACKGAADGAVEVFNLCGLSKGYAVDTVCARLGAELGVTDALFTWAGDMKALGRSPLGRAWRSAVKLHDEDETVLDLIRLRPDEAVATSGDYVTGGLAGSNPEHSHIYNAASSRPVPRSPANVALCAVLCKGSAMFSDALATAVVSVGDNEAAAGKLLKELHTTNAPHQVRDYIYYTQLNNKLVKCNHPGVESASCRKERHECHSPARVIVVGGGLAGLTAAVYAAKAGAHVVLLEKEARTGGNSAKATSGINGWGTDTQVLDYGVRDDERFFERDTFVSAVGGTSYHGLVRLLSAQSKWAIDFLKTEIGVPLTVLSQLGGHSRMRSHRAPPKPDGTPTPIGATIMQGLRRHIAEKYSAQIEVRTGCEVMNLIHENDEVRGVSLLSSTDKTDGVDAPEASSAIEEIRGDAVVLCTGGFGYGSGRGGMLHEVRPDLEGVPTTCGEWTTGSGIRLGAEVGATLIDMDKVQLHPTSFIDPKHPLKKTKFLGPEALRGSGGLLLDQAGKRFVNELDLRSVVSAAILEKGQAYPGTNLKFAHCVLNKRMQKAFGLPLLGFYKEKMGLFRSAGSLPELADLVGCSQETLRATFAAYDASVAEGVCRDTGKKVFPCPMLPEDGEEEGYVVAAITPAVHYCMGGLEISPAGEVQQPIVGGSKFGKRKPVKRLFAAGECTGGVHGANRLGGNSLLECVVMGRVCGDRAGTINQKFSTCIVKDKWTPLVLRERKDANDKFGLNTCRYRFNLHGALQSTGMLLGEFLAVKGELDGETLQGYFSPVTRPQDCGSVEILSREDDKGGPIVRLLQSLRPGSAVYVKAMGGLQLRVDEYGRFEYKGRTVKKINLIAGGTGIAPMVQIIRTFMKAVDVETCNPDQTGVRLVYAAEERSDLAFTKSAELVAQEAGPLFASYITLNRPPTGWTQGVGILEPEDMVHNLYAAREKPLNVVCGPPIFEKFMVKNLVGLGHTAERIFAYSQETVAWDN